MIDQLRQKANITERPFRSPYPFVARFRRWWNNISTRWYVLGMFEQQQSYNQLSADLLAEQKRLSAELHRQLRQQDRTIVLLTRTVAELETELKRLRRSLEESAGA